MSKLHIVWEGGFYIDVEVMIISYGAKINSKINEDVIKLYYKNFKGRYLLNVYKSDS